VKPRLLDEAGVTRFLYANPDVELSLPEALASVNASFGEDTPVYLSLERDPDSGEESLILLVYRPTYRREERAVFRDTITSMKCSVERFFMMPIFALPELA